MDPTLLLALPNRSFTGLARPLESTQESTNK